MCRYFPTNTYYDSEDNNNKPQTEKLNAYRRIRYPYSTSSTISTALISYNFLINNTALDLNGDVFFLDVEAKIVPRAN